MQKLALVTPTPHLLCHKKAFAKEELRNQIEWLPVVMSNLRAASDDPTAGKLAAYESVLQRLDVTWVGCPHRGQGADIVVGQGDTIKGKISTIAITEPSEGKQSWANGLGLGPTEVNSAGCQKRPPQD